jgi:thiol-disulfide isomerase/thioredoxin
MIRRINRAATASLVRARVPCALRLILFFLSILILDGSAVGAELELRYYGATWCAPCHRVEPMVDLWAAQHPGLRIVKFDYDAHKADRERFYLVGVPILVLLDGDKLIAKYGDKAQKISDFAQDRLELWFESVKDKTDGASR